MKVIEGRLIVNTDNDPDFHLDDDDHKIKDQHDGFQGWFAAQFNSDTLADPTSTHGFENLFPILLRDLPKLPDNNMKYELRINHAGAVIPNFNSGNNRLDYLTSSSNTDSLKTALLAAGTSHSILQHDTTGDLEFIFGIYQTGATANNQVSLLLYPDKTNAPNVYYTLDNSLYTFRPVDKYFWMGSTRGTANVSYNYPTEDGRTIQNFQTYPNVTKVQGFADNYDLSKDILVFLHGFNVNEMSAKSTNRIIFRRLFWMGFRDNFLGIIWQGTYGDEGIMSKVNFDTCVAQALRTSPAINTFLNTFPENRKVNIAAHSLGNLVMWDALRIEREKQSPRQLGKNVISIQGAIWEEVFSPRYKVEYLAEPERENNITYTTSDLMRHSWAFWFHDMSNLYSGTFCNSSTFFDYALIAQKIWNATPTTDAFSRILRGSRYRTPTDLPLLYPLMKQGSRIPYNPVYGDIYYRFLHDPIGISPNIGSRKINARQVGWGVESHSDFKDVPFYDIAEWYKRVFIDITGIIR